MTASDHSIWIDAHQGSGAGGGIVYGLLKDLNVATKLLKAAQICHLRSRNFSRSETLLAACEQEKPILIILDWDGLEAESFKLLKQLSENVDFNRVATVGYSSKSKQNLQSEAQRAGCDRVYMKTEFLRSLNDIFMRYAL